MTADSAALSTTRHGGRIRRQPCGTGRQDTTSNAPGSQPNNWLFGFAGRLGIIGGGLVAGRLLNSYAERQRTVAESGFDLGVSPEGQPGLDGAAHFLKIGPNTPYEGVLPVTATITDVVQRYRQPPKEFVQFDPAKFARHYDLSRLSPDNRTRLGVPQPAGIDPPEKPTREPDTAPLKLSAGKAIIEQNQDVSRRDTERDTRGPPG